MTVAPAQVRKGELSRERILVQAVDIATREGLEAITIGRIALSCQLTKAGVLGHFGSKEMLQIATLNAGALHFFQNVGGPLLDSPPGMVHLARVLDAWFRYVDRTRGGCFFASVTAEFDAREGPVHDLIATMVRRWLTALTVLTDRAKERDHLRADLDSAEFAFRLYGYELSMNMHRQLFQDTGAAEQGRKVVFDAVRAVATPLGLSLLETAL